MKGGVVLNLVKGGTVKLNMLFVIDLLYCVLMRRSRLCRILPSPPIIKFFSIPDVDEYAVCAAHNIYHRDQSRSFQAAKDRRTSIHT